MSPSGVPNGSRSSIALTRVPDRACGSVSGALRAVPEGFRRGAEILSPANEQYTPHSSAVPSAQKRVPDGSKSASRVPSRAGGEDEAAGWSLI